ncbi:HD domain-containing protein [Fictibacillus sp. KIGAM418]|uniref:HD domain-containing protein n=1 Tax=Fictibacillus marinisediminis TaxID=2878389 RepID=A0A9X2BCR8_9BACL|nr:HD domain-containing protein [Fictibacillus marinisediminis]MCK6257169.1 HD domain-containing protein [Fictibacillus marinisediminis]
MKRKIIEAAERYVQETLRGEGSGHDWWHIYRVNKLALTIAEKEGADPFVCSLAALLHDIADEKFNASEEAGLQKVSLCLTEHEVTNPEKQHVLEIISTMSFKGGNSTGMKTIEGMAVQDADRLDALGAIGIARTFAYSGFAGQMIYDPDIPVRNTMTKSEYRNGVSTAINHFYEKLLTLKDRMNTEHGKKLAESRHQQMVSYLDVFFSEWEGIR